MKDSQKTAEKGFTLIELMIVIAIIGILSAIAIPNFLTYRQKGYDAEALTNARDFYTTCASSSTGQNNKTFSAGSLPGGYLGDPPDSGTFTYTALTGVITCDAVFSHNLGTFTYTLNNAGSIVEASK